MALAAIVLLSLSLKFLFLRADVAVDTTTVAVKLAALAEKRGMSIKLRPIFGGTAMLATKGTCEMGARAMPPSGEIDQSAVNEFRRFTRLRYSFEGSLTGQRPRLRPLVTYQWARAFNRLGIAVAWRPLLLVGDNGRCAANLTDFGTIRDPLRQQVSERQAS